MTIRQAKTADYVALLAQHATDEGMNRTALDTVITYRASAPEQCKKMVYEPMIVLGGQGQKQGTLNGQRYTYSAGNFLAVLLPMPIEVELVEATPDKPFLATYIRVDLQRMAALALKIDRVANQPPKPAPVNPSGIFSAPLHENLLDPAIRLLKVLGQPTDAALLGDAIVDEIYYRILCDEQGGSLTYLLQQRGQIQRVARAVEYIHQNLDEQVSVEKLASLVNMSSSGFHKSFKEVMHSSPLQYAKSIKLFHAQTYLHEGKNASEAGHLVGYNSPAQFSREFKRHFGVSPSALTM